MRIALVVLATAGAMVPWLIGAPLTHACSVGEDFDPIAASDVIVGGRITGWELIENVTRWDPKSGEPEPTDDPNYFEAPTYDPIRLNVTVDKVYKGSVPASIELVAANTYEILDGQGNWVGASGACGAFDSDPTGHYWILGLNEDDFGRLRPSRVLVFDSSEVLEARLGPASLPTSGGAPHTTNASDAHLMSIAGGIALIAASGAVLRRTAFQSL
jgi:hypothetical protein